jgi:ssDNA-binding Zn-finger/Zn-ribbon topoisomerase 1
MSELCPKCESKMLFQEASYENFNGCRTYTCASSFRKSGGYYFQSQLCKERDAHNQTKRERDEAIELLIESSAYSNTASQENTEKFLRKIGKWEDVK